MQTVNYYPKQDRLDFIGEDNMPEYGFMGNIAHLKAIQLAMQNTVAIAVCLDSKINKKKTLKN